MNHATRKPYPMGTTENRLSLEVCKRIMNKNGLNYADNEIIQIRDFLYLMAEISTNHFHRKVTQETKIISLTDNENNVKTKSIPLHPGKYRRTG